MSFSFFLFQCKVIPTLSFPVFDILTLHDVYTDHDNSGSIDFDEFANWIMNSDYKSMAAGPKAKRNKKKIMKVISPEESLREKVKTAIEEYPQTFERLFSRPTIGYMDFMGDLNRMNMRSLTERDVRELYLLLDPNDTSEITLQLFNDWVYKGIKGRPASTLSRQAKRERPLGKKPIPPMTAKPLTQSVCDSKTAHFKSTSFLRPATNSHLPKELQPSVDPQHGSSVTSADRRLKALLSKEFKLLKASIERNANVDRVGYISTDMLYGLITRYCGIFSVADWKLVLLTLKTDEEKKRIDYKHFLAKYDPDVKIALQLEIYQEKLQTTKGMKKTMSIGSFCGYPTPR